MEVWQAKQYVHQQIADLAITEATEQDLRRRILQRPWSEAFIAALHAYMHTHLLLHPTASQV